MRTIDWRDGTVEIIDQAALPATLHTLRLATVDELIDAIVRLRVRGAPALGVAGALGVALAAQQYRGDALDDAVNRIAAARPTAVNLARAARRVASRLPDGPEAALVEALRIRDEEIDSSRRMATTGADLVTELCGPSPRLLTHCNTGALAAVVGGTALGVVTELHRRSTLGGVLVSETRPLLQGSRLTAWELGRLGIPYEIVVDGAGPFLMARGRVDAVILGADRVCANGDVVNKVGSFAHALGARHAGIPFVVVAPESTVDPATPDGDAVTIEDRDPDEVLCVGGTRIAPEDARAVNPAFDVVPADLVTAVVTDHRVIRSQPAAQVG